MDKVKLRKLEITKEIKELKDRAKSLREVARTHDANRAIVMNQIRLYQDELYKLRAEKES